jgi:hypothetical protein
MIKKAILFIISFLIFALGFVQTVFGIGMLTEPIILKDVLRGQEVSEIVTVFNPEDSPITYKLGA